VSAIVGPPHYEWIVGTDIYMYAERRTGARWSLCSPHSTDPGVAFPEALEAGSLVPDGARSTRRESDGERAGDEFTVDTVALLKSHGRPQDVQVVFWFSC
jgi:hypothetical protein